MATGAGSGTRRFLLCLKNRGYSASLEIRKVYASDPDEEAESHGLVRVIDEYGESYLYPEKFFFVGSRKFVYFRSFFCPNC